MATRRSLLTGWPRHHQPDGLDRLRQCTAPKHGVRPGRATAAMTRAARLPSDDPTLPSQVQTDIRFVEVSRTKLKEASTSIFGKARTSCSARPAQCPTPGADARVVPLRNIDPRIAAPGIPLANDVFNIVAGGGNFLAIINALESSGFAYTLARPSLVALSGQSASFLPAAKSRSRCPAPTATLPSSTRSSASA
jgi:pilus assembly protein CpaC